MIIINDDNITSQWIIIIEIECLLLLFVVVDMLLWFVFKKKYKIIIYY